MILHHETQYMKIKAVHDAWNCTNKEGKEYLKPIPSQIRIFLNEQIKQRKVIYRSQCLIRDSSLVYLELNSPSEYFKLQKNAKISITTDSASFKFRITVSSSHEFIYTK